MLKPTKLISTDRFSLALALAITLLIAYLSLMPTANLPNIKFDKIDKFYHFTAYMFLSFSWFIYWCIFKNKWKSSFLLFLTTSIIMFGIVIEVFQENFTDYRTFDWWDILFNTAAIVFVFLIFEINKTKLGKLSHRLNV